MYNKEQRRENIIFLDIDGPIYVGSMSDPRNISSKNAERNEIKSHPSFAHIDVSMMEKLKNYDLYAVLGFSKPAVDNLLTLCIEYDAKIVISSAWREQKSLTELKALFSIYAFSQYIIDCTPVIKGASRELEIESWLLSNKLLVNSFIILDDTPFYLREKFGTRFVACNSLFSDEALLAKARVQLEKPFIENCMETRLWWESLEMQNSNLKKVHFNPEQIAILRFCGDTESSYIPDQVFIDQFFFMLAQNTHIMHLSLNDFEMKIMDQFLSVLIHSKMPLQSLDLTNSQLKNMDTLLRILDGKNRHIPHLYLNQVMQQPELSGWIATYPCTLKLELDMHDPKWGKRWHLLPDIFTALQQNDRISLHIRDVLIPWDLRLDKQIIDLSLSGSLYIYDKPDQLQQWMEVVLSHINSKYFGIEYLLERMGRESVEKIINIRAIDFCWDTFLIKIEPDRRRDFLLAKDGLLEHIKNIKDLNTILAHLPKTAHQDFYNLFDEKLFTFIKQIDDLESINASFHPRLIKSLGYPYLASVLLNSPHDILNTVPKIPVEDRFVLMACFNQEKLQTLFNKADDWEKICALMPKEEPQLSVFRASINPVINISGRINELRENPIKFYSLLNEILEKGLDLDQVLSNIGEDNLKKIIGLPDSNFYVRKSKWHNLMNNIHSDLILPLLSYKNWLFNELKNCGDLGLILHYLPQSSHNALYKQLGTSLFSIVNNIFDLRDIAEHFHKNLIQYLGYEHIASITKNAYYILETLPKIPEADRFTFLQCFSEQKLRNYFYHAKDSENLLRLMPPGCHEALKNILFLFEIEMKEQKKIQNPHATDRSIHFTEGALKYHMKQPFYLSETEVIGIGRWRHKIGSSVYYGDELVVYDLFLQKIITRKKNVEMVHPVYFPVETRFIAKHSQTQRWEEYTYAPENKSLMRGRAIHSAEHQSSSKGVLITLPDNRIMLLSSDLGRGKNWYIDIINPHDFTMKRELEVSHGTDSVNSMTLLDDKRTVLVWHDFITVSEQMSSSTKAFQVHLIDLDDFAIQTFLLPIKSPEISGSISAVFSKNNTMYIEFTVKQHICLNLFNKEVFSFDYKRINKQALKKSGVFFFNPSFEEKGRGFMQNYGYEVRGIYHEDRPILIYHSIFSAFYLDELQKQVLQNILTFFPHNRVNNWHKNFMRFNSSKYPANLLYQAANAVDCAGNTVLSLACEYGEVDAIKKLIQFGAKVNPENDTKPPIYWAIANKNAWGYQPAPLQATEPVKCLLMHGAKTNIRPYKDLTPLEYARSRGYVDAAKLIGNYQAERKKHFSIGASIGFFKAYALHSDIGKKLVDSEDISNIGFTCKEAYERGKEEENNFLKRFNT